MISEKISILEKDSRIVKVFYSRRLILEFPITFAHKENPCYQCPAAGIKYCRKPILKSRSYSFRDICSLLGKEERPDFRKINPKSLHNSLRGGIVKKVHIKWEDQF